MRWWLCWSTQWKESFLNVYIYWIKLYILNILVFFVSYTSLMLKQGKKTLEIHFQHIKFYNENISSLLFKIMFRKFHLLLLKWWLCPLPISMDFILFRHWREFRNEMKCAKEPKWLRKFSDWISFLLLRSSVAWKPYWNHGWFCRYIGRSACVNWNIF